MAEIAKPGIDLGLFVHDEAGQCRFYGEALALPYLGQLELPNGRLHVYACGDSLLKLYHLQGAGPKATEPAEQARIGYFTINVVDIEADVARLRRHDIAVGDVARFDAEVELAQPVGHVRALYALTTDADGNQIELFQRL